jgi:type IX secretion system PorP/SprF family membrane protein
MKKTLFLFLLTLSVSAQNALTDNYQFNLLGLSPAFTGERGNYGFTVALGNQFNGTLRPNQVSQIFSVDGVLKDGPSAMGFQGYRSAYGNLTTNGFTLSYAYGLETSSNIDIKLGINLGFLVLPNAFNVTEIAQRFTSYGGLGLMVKNDRFFANVSSPTLLSSSFGQIFLNGRKVNFIAGYIFGNSDGIALAPSVYYAANSDPNFGNNLNAGTKIWVFDKWILGLSARNNSATQKTKLVSSLEYNLNGSSRFGISYDPIPSDLINVPSIGNINTGVIQLMYRYDLSQLEERELLNWF